MPTLSSPRLPRLGFLVLLFLALVASANSPATAATFIRIPNAAQAVGIGVGGDNLTRLLWRNYDSSIALWRMNADGSVATQYPDGPYPGWTTSSFAIGADNVPRLLWNHPADGQMSLWRMDPTANTFTQNFYGPYSGWASAALTVGGNNAPRVL